MGSFDSVLALLSLGTVFFLFTRKRRPLPLPPGPRGLPIIGNFFNRPTKNAFLVYKDWGTLYKSDIVSMEVLGQPTVIINTVKVAKELLEGRSEIYADRPRKYTCLFCSLTSSLHLKTGLYMLTELMRWSWGFSFMRYSADWTYVFSQSFQSFWRANRCTDFIVKCFINMLGIIRSRTTMACRLKPLTTSFGTCSSSQGNSSTMFGSEWRRQGRCLE